MDRKKFANLVSSLVLGSVCETVYHFETSVSGVGPEVYILNVSKNSVKDKKSRDAEKINSLISINEDFVLEVSFHISGIAEPIVSITTYKDGKMIETDDSAFDVTFHESFI